MTANANGRIKKTSVVFQPAARLLRLLGEELISDEVIAVAELIKNSHDADATRCSVSFTGVTQTDGEIVIRDDGVGMTVDEFLHGWMQPGTSPKRDQKGQQTKRGRRVLGEKGVGRFAVDKLARQAELITRRRGSAAEIHASFDWDDYDQEGLLLADVPSFWEERPAQVLEAPGTILHLRGLRSRWSERLFRRLCTRLARLMTPRHQPQDFQILIDSDEFPDYSGPIHSDFLRKAPYQLKAVFDGEERIECQVGGARSRQSWPGPGSLKCGPVKVELYGFDLESPSLARIGPNVEVRAWLREWSGVSIYRDGFRVWPYGEPHDDWLGLDQRRVNNPVVCLSNNQVLGFVEISRDGNPLLLDQTNREGLMHNPALDDLRRLVLFLFVQLEAHRQTIRHPQANGILAPRDTSGDQPLADLVQLAVSLPPQAAARVRKVHKNLEEFLARQAQAQARGLREYVTRTAAGQVLLSLSRELWLCQETAGDTEPDAFYPLITRHLQDFQALSQPHKRRRAIDLEAEVQECLPLFEAQAGRRNVRVIVKSQTHGKLARAEMRPELGRCLLVLLFEQVLGQDAEVRSQESGGRSQGSGVRSQGALIVRATDERAGVDCCLSENGWMERDAANGVGSAEQALAGLTLVKELCTSLGGELTVQAGRGEGLTYRLDFRRKQARATR